MRVLLQKVTRASVSVEGSVVGSIGTGYLLFVGVMQGDTEAQAAALAEKVLKLRLFAGSDGKINDVSVVDAKGGLLVVSQFTLAGRTEKGNRPDYTSAAKPEEAKALYTSFIEKLKLTGLTVATGEFGAHMQVELCNDGPVTLYLQEHDRQM